MAMRSFPVVPLAISVAAGAADGAISATDAKAGRTAWDKQYATYGQAGLIGLGLIGGFAGWDPDLSEPLLLVGTALATRRASFAAMKPTVGTPAQPVAGYGYRAAVAPRTAPAVGGGAPAVAAGYNYRQQPGALA